MDEKDIPININSGKLLDWVINRRHCNKNWQIKIKETREKINDALQDMPAHDKIVELLSGTYINYFHCVKIVEILKETEADTKNLFGKYGSQRMKDWQEILRLYEKDNIYLAEAAQILIRNVNYEIPSLKKQIQKFEQLAVDYEKKEQEYKKQEKAAQAEFDSVCKKLDISGLKIKHELIDKISELLEIFEDVANKTKPLSPALNFYNEFIKYLSGTEHNDDYTYLVKHVAEKGNTTVYEYTYGEVPVRIEEPKVDINVEEEINLQVIENNEQQIDFGNLNIDNLDLTIDDTNQDGADIDWGAEIDFGTEETNKEEEIDFNINLEESGIVVEGSGEDEKVARGNHAYTILDNPETQSLFIDQLYELRTFLRMRLHEVKSDDGTSMGSVLQMHGAPVNIQFTSIDHVQNMLDNVQIVISAICNHKVFHLHNIKHNPRYVETFSNLLKRKYALIDKHVKSQNEMRKKRDETIEKAAAVKPIVNLVVQKTKELRLQIEKDISKKYKNRIVNLTGAINTI